MLSCLHLNPEDGTAFGWAINTDLAALQVNHVFDDPQTESSAVFAIGGAGTELTKLGEQS